MGWPSWMAGALALALCACSVAACGGDDDGVSGDGGGVRDGGIVADGGGGLDAPMADGGGRVDAGPPPPCPAALPETGDPCAAVGQVCFYELCPEGVYRVECGGVGWEPEMQPCESWPCSLGGGSETCMGDQLCVLRTTGAAIVTCEDDPCGDGPITPECACALCGDLMCTVDGFNVTCASDCTKCP